MRIIICIDCIDVRIIICIDCIDVRIIICIDCIDVRIILEKHECYTAVFSWTFPRASHMCESQM